MQESNHTSLVGIIQACLRSDDDPAFWGAAIQVLAFDIEAEITDGSHNCDVYLNIGACSHWLRPHQTRWTAAGGFAWPTGYGGGTWSRRGLPQFDWSQKFLWDVSARSWKPVDRFKGKRKLSCRVALPTRTARHDQAAIHTLWEPGTPTTPTEKRLRFYGFRKQDGNWACVASKDI